MTVWDFMAGAFTWLFDAPGFADAFFRCFFVTLIVLIAIEALPVKYKPLSWIARRIGRAFNADMGDRVTKIEKRQAKNEKDSVRLQLLMLIHDYPEDKSEILECAQHYFSDLHGDWYLTPIFNKWLTDNDIGKPEWFDPKK